MGWEATSSVAPIISESNRKAGIDPGLHAFEFESYCAIVPI